MSKRFLTFLLCCAILVVACDEKEDNGTTSGNGDGVNGHEPGEQVTMDSVDGLYAIDSVKTDTLITFYIRLTNNTGGAITGLTHGFRICSPDGATWDTTIGIDGGGITDAMIDQGIFVNSFSISGSRSDTVGFGGFRTVTGTGIPDGFDEVAFAVQIGPISTSYHGRRICIDSSWYPPGGDWLWATSGDPIHPNWDGARCFWIVNPSALSGRRGDTDSEK